MQKFVKLTDILGQRSGCIWKLSPYGSWLQVREKPVEPGRVLHVPGGSHEQYIIIHLHQGKCCGDHRGEFFFSLFKHRRSLLRKAPRSTSPADVPLPSVGVSPVIYVEIWGKYGFSLACSFVGVQNQNLRKGPRKVSFSVATQKYQTFLQVTIIVIRLVFILKCLCSYPRHVTFTKENMSFLPTWGPWDWNFSMVEASRKNIF